jgi:SNF2 family DNA or RNA helicase
MRRILPSDNSQIGLQPNLQGGVCLETTFDYLRQFGPALAERILETYPPLQSIRDPIAPSLASLLRKPLPAQAVAITGTAKYLRNAKAARIVAECGAGKTLMALASIHVLSEGRPTTTLVMCPSHITHKWAREVLLTIPRARTFLIEDMRNGGERHQWLPARITPAKPY